MKRPRVKSNRNVVEAAQMAKKGKSTHYEAVVFTASTVSSIWDAAEEDLNFVKVFEDIWNGNKEALRTMHLLEDTMNGMEDLVKFNLFEDTWTGNEEVLAALKVTEDSPLRKSRDDAILTKVSGGAWDGIKNNVTNPQRI